MKFIGYILSFYLILLATVPCCAIDNCPDDKTEQSSGHENGDDDGCGSCSPFFNCEGCATATIAYEPVQFDFALLISSPVHTPQQQASLAEADIDFWQPPKLS